MLRQATTGRGSWSPDAPDASSEAPGPEPGAPWVQTPAGPAPASGPTVRSLTGLVVDDHAIARRGLLSLVAETFPEAAPWLAASTGPEALELARVHQPDMVLMDVRTADLPSGPALVARLLAVAPSAQVVVTVGGTPGDDVKRCLETGAAGAIWKGSPEAEIALVLRQIESGGRIIDVQIAAALQEREEHHRRSPVALTDRERTVLELLAEGCSNREIGERLVLSPATIKDHVRHLLRKLDATSRLQALVNAADAGMLQLGADRSR
ncbi:response regulator transcription factor [Patulibacter sp.]|uniref:LuxR C-terminal-related transcriptional regulator n=1 Tax=Patulibacter sp. TaxID=1912859 RepID=UPI0027194C1C|nr:response regulator transcription factor [Patulibacter sp.]MDO9408742.1 response regulator transcription factor [Patulibacter sp.]